MVWARPWAAPLLCRRLCSPSAKRTMRCWTKSRACQTCKARGCYSSCAGPRAPIVGCAFSRPKLRSSLPAGMMQQSRGAPHATHTGDAAGALAAGNGRAGPPLCGRWPIRGLLGFLGRHAAHIAGSPPACGGGHRPVLQRRHRPTCPTGPQHRGTRRSRVPLAMPGLHYSLWEILVGGGRPPQVSQAGSGGPRAIIALPTAPEFRIPNVCIRVLLLRRLRAPLPHTPRQCRCGGRLDPLGDHRAACPAAGVLGARGAPLERAATRMCREAGARVATNVFTLRDMTVGLPLADSRRVEVLAKARSPGRR